MKFSTVFILIVLFISTNCSSRYENRNNRRRRNTHKHLRYHNPLNSKFLKGNGFDLADNKSNLKTFNQGTKYRKRKRQRENYKEEVQENKNGDKFEVYEIKDFVNKDFEKAL